MINKRLRCNEYIGSFITAEVSKRINRLVSLGDKATIKDLLNAFRFPEDVFMTRLYSSGVLRYAENDSDIDMALRVKYTAKGESKLNSKYKITDIITKVWALLLIIVGNLQLDYYYYGTNVRSGNSNIFRIVKI